MKASWAIAVLCGAIGGVAWFVASGDALAAVVVGMFGTAIGVFVAAGVRRSAPP